MAVLRVVRLGAPVLRTRASEVETHDLKKGRLKPFFDDLMETMAEYHGTGLAAPQVSQPLRIVLYEIQPESRGKGIEVPPTILVNPLFEILDPAETEEYEACLSIPFLAAKVPRARRIRVRALDRSGRPLDFVAHDFHARVVLHESDHLDGTVYLDRVRDRASIRYTIDY